MKYPNEVSRFSVFLTLLVVCILGQCSGGQELRIKTTEAKTMTDKMTVTMNKITTSYGAISYTDTGKGKPLFLLHAAGHDHNDFESIHDELAKSYRVIALDWLGHGKSDYPDPSSEISAVMLAEVLREIVYKLDLEPAIFLGNSVGAFASASLAVSDPKKVKALVLVDSGGFFEHDFKARAFCSFKGSEFWTGVLWNKFPSFYLKIKNDNVLKILQNIRNEKSERAIAVNAAMWRSFASPDHDLRESGKRISAPTLVIWGKLDPVIPVTLAETVVKTIPNSKLKLLDTGHMPFAEDPEGFLKVLIPFLEEI